MKKKLDEEIIIEWLVIPIVLVFAFTVWWLSSQSLVPQEEETTTETTTRIVENIVENVENTKIPETDTETYTEKEMVLTAYCSCVECCDKDDRITATGTLAKQGRTIAVDPRYIPYGTEVIIDGVTYIAEDCGGAIKGNRIDVYFDGHSEALEFGRQTKIVRVML
jgi:3D (Asp-Asp-Asp) domain-containing protein